MIEVEVKAHVGNFKDVKLKLDEIDAKETIREHQIDTYFNNPSYRDFAKTDEALRIRRTTINNDKSRVFITYKGAKLDETSKTRKELEMKIEDPNLMSSILESLGFKPAADVEKERTTYIFNEFIISLDNVLKVGKFVEIEKEMKEGENFDSALDEIFKIYKKLGIENGFERRSYLELMGIYKD